MRIKAIVPWTELHGRNRLVRWWPVNPGYKECPDVQAYRGLQLLIVRNEGQKREFVMPAPDPILPFGAFKGKHVSAVGVIYLDWLIGQRFMQQGHRNRKLHDEILAHLKTRAEWHRLEDED